MNIWMLTTLFDPEPNFLKGLAFCQRLSERGHTVTVWTGFPQYPYGHIYPGYKNKFVDKSQMNGINVGRCMTFPSHDKSVIRRMTTLLLTPVIMCLFFLTMTIEKPPDVVYVYVGPLTLMLPARILKWRSKAKVLLDVQDLWPQSVCSSGMLKNAVFTRLLISWCKKQYQMADRIICLSDGYKNEISKFSSLIPIDVVYNWTSDAIEQIDVETTLTSNSNGRFTIVYAGNLGPLQDLHTVIQGMKLINQDVVLDIYGSGLDELSLRDIAHDTPNVVFHGRVQQHDIVKYSREADALLIPMSSDEINSSGIPQKVQASLAMGRVIVAGVHGDARVILQDAPSVYMYDVENPLSFALVVNQVSRLSKEQVEFHGGLNREYYMAHFHSERGIDKIGKIIGEVSCQ